MCLSPHTLTHSSLSLSIYMYLCTSLIGLSVSEIRPTFNLQNMTAVISVFYISNC